MDISYLGHSAFKLKGKAGTVVTDPYDPYIGLTMPGVSADIITVSHHHKDHDASGLVKPTARRERPFLIEEPGEYEVGGISVFGVQTYHDESQGTERGSNIIFTILLDDIRVCHLGDLGHELTQEQIAEIGTVDVLLCPVGGAFTIDPVQATKIIHQLEPSIAIPMHYRTTAHNSDVFADMKTLEEFLKVYGVDVASVDTLTLDKERLPEETELKVLNYGG